MSSFVIQKWYQHRSNMATKTVKNAIKIIKNCVWSVFSAMSRPLRQNVAKQAPTALQPGGLQPRAPPLVFESPFYQKSTKNITPKHDKNGRPKPQTITPKGLESNMSQFQSQNASQIHATIGFVFLGGGENETICFSDVLNHANLLCCRHKTRFRKVNAQTEKSSN